MIARVTRWALLGLALVVGIIARVRYIDWSIHDDAWISFRYARNLVRGDGLVMNAGERVEGITNFLWTLMAAPVLALGADPAPVMQWLGGILSLVLAAGVYAFTARRLGGGVLAALVPLLLAFNLAYIVESLSGLETLLFAALVFAAYVAFLEERHDASRRPGLWAALCAAATLVRPEGTLLFGIFVAWLALGIARGESPLRLRHALLVYVVLVLPLFAFRFAYYGSMFPNTFYAKVGYTADQLARGWRYTRYAFVFTLTLPMLAIAASLLVGLVARGRRGIAARTAHAALAARAVPAKPETAAEWTQMFAGRYRDEALALALLLVFVWVAYVWAVGGDYEPTGRFHMPVLIFVYLAFQEGLRDLAGLVRGRAQVAMGVVALAAGLLLGARSEQRFFVILSERGWPHVRRSHHEQLVAAGRWFNEHTAPDTRIALSSIGALAYFADRPIIDMMGLTDAHISRRRMPTMGQGAAGHEKGDGAYVLSRNPEIILLDKGFFFTEPAAVEKVLEGARGVSEIEIVRDPTLSERYDLLDTPIEGGILYWLQRK